MRFSPNLIPLNSCRLIAFFTCFMLSVPAARTFEHPGGLHTAGLLISVKTAVEQNQEPWKEAFDALIEQADENLLRTPEAVEDFNVPGYYDDPDGHRLAMDRLSNDAWTAYACAIAWQLSPENAGAAYAEKALEVLNNWARVNKKTSNYDGDLAMTDAGVGLVLAAELMHCCSDWQGSDQDNFVIWLRNVYLTSCNKIVLEKNNWGDWAILGRLSAHYFLDEEALIEQDIELLKSKIDDEIAADGSMPLETARGKRGLWYTYFALAPLTAACQIAQNAGGIDLFHYKGADGAGVEEALAYFFTYCLEPEAWPHYQGSDLNKAKPTRWPGNLFEAMSDVYDNDVYAEWIVQARPVMEYGHHYAWAAPTLLKWPADAGQSSAGSGRSVIPDDCGLEPVFPNPFNPCTTIAYSLNQSSFVHLDVYDVRGQHQLSLVEGIKSRGKHQVEFNASGFSSGIYFYRLCAEGKILTRKMMLMQ